MIDGMRVLGVISARGGSKRLPRKNVLPLAGKPLIAWTIEAGQGSRLLDRLILSSEDEEIINVARDFGCEVPFRRPAHLAQDDTPGVAPVLHALEAMGGYDYVVLLQPTSPLRVAADIDAAIRQCHTTQAPSCVSVTRMTKPPQWMYALDAASRLRSMLPPSEGRQEAPAYLLNGAVYVARTHELMTSRNFVVEATVGYEMPAKRSVDVDTETDFRWCELLLEGS